MKEERIWLLAARKLSGEASADEINELEILLDAYPEFRSTIEIIEEYWEEPPLKPERTNTVEKLLIRINVPNFETAGTGKNKII